LELTPENVKDYFEILVVSVINIVNYVIPDMIVRGEGALLFTTGLSAAQPLPFMGNAGIAGAGLRNYLANLHTELSPKRITVTNRSLGVQLTTGTGSANDPEVIADMWYQVYVKKLWGDDVYP
jgi:short-subunit dehydrogenase